MIKAVLFDVDGVLIDSFEANLKFFQTLMIKTGYEPPTREGFKDIFPLNLVDAIRTLTKSSSEKEVMRISDIGRSRKTGYDFDLLTLPNNAEHVLKILRERYRLGIVTGRIDPYESPALADLSHYFEVAIAYGDTQRHKPNPEPLLLAASQMKINPEECVYVGDAISDFEAATSAGMKFVMYTEGETVAQTSVDSFEALPPLINSL